MLRPLFLFNSFLSISTEAIIAFLAKFFGTPPVTLVSNLDPRLK